ncbi:arginine-glutamic acid dipeptide repeats protein-like [Sander lucioperca]|uniref:arginine-glutamic acid dipeptide repeats protein-like n=1 Tax=Sander lucioperca TaxID=283035 RepID=UPI001653680E|nr:arginine-glutamic acid dipeptide repeats protein-like [Sander lucioperca]
MEPTYRFGPNGCTVSHSSQPLVFFLVLSLSLCLSCFPSSPPVYCLPADNTHLLPIHHHRSPATHTCQPSAIKLSTSTLAQQTISAESLSQLHRVRFQASRSSQLASPSSPPPTAPCFTLPPSPRPASPSSAPLLPCSSVSSSGLWPRFPHAPPSSLAILVSAPESLAILGFPP